MNRVAFAKMDEDGRIEIPAALREALGFEPGLRLQLKLDGAALRIVTMDEAIRRVQAKYKDISPERSLVDELLAERRREVEQAANEVEREARLGHRS